MSYNLWKSLIENDVDSFRQHVARANYNNATKTVSGFHVGSPGTLGTSPKTPKARRGGHIGSAGKSSGVHWTKAEINARDRQGLTILHHAASSRNENALEFVKILLGSSQLDLYIQDAENGWTALHRALYFGNVDIAQALMLRDLQNATDYAASTVHAQAGGLIKIKDHEGNSPFEVFGYTIAPRILQSTDPAGLDIGGDDDSVNGVDVRDETVNTRAARLVQPRVDLQGDEFYAFGSNKNLTLGLGDGDDRQFPERIHLQRPDYLLRRLHEDYVFESKESTSTDPNNSVQTLPMPSALPAIIQNKPIIIQEVIMSKLHTAILTKDPISNLHVTGFGPGGRLGAGDEITRFNFVCIQGALAKRRVSTIALGQDHTIAICSSGEVFTWGNAQDGKLGYTLPEISPKEVPVQLVPRQLYGLVKKEQIVGAAASAIHSIIFTPTALFAFGRNAGQLGLVDADARSLEVQVIPRRVGTSILQSPIQSVAAIDRATTVLLENHDVIVFTHYAYKKIIFPFEEAPELYSNTALRTVYDKEPNSIVKVTNGGNTICAVSSFGQVFTIDVPKEADHVPANVSTTNPNKARNALPQPSRVWSIGKSHMAAIDAAVGQDGSIILCTTSGAVWRKEKRANIKSIHEKPAGTANVKDYKFVRVSNITRAIAVRSNAKGAFGVVRKDCEVTRDQITEDPPSLKDAIFPLLAFHDYGTTEDENSTEPQLRFWVSHKKKASPDLIKHAVLTGKTVEDDFLTMFKRFEPLSASGYDVWITSNVTDIRIPVHSFLLRARSHALHTAFLTFLDTYYVEISDAVALEYGQDGQIHIKFKGADFLTLINLVLYLYSDNVVDVWHYTSRALQLAPRYRQIRVEVMKIAAVLGLEGLERSARVMVEPVQSIMRDMENAWVDTNFFDDADVIIDLASDAQMPAHSVLLRARCPFFEALFHGHAGGGWMSSRRNEVDGIAEPIRVDLKHFEERTFEMVLRYIYADTSEEMFDDVESNDLDEFLDLVIDVLSIANELMLDRLAQICQKVVGKFVTMRNVCGLLNTIAECSVTDFKTVALEYICLNLEGMLAQRLLEELDEYLVEELVEVVRENQLAYMPIARSDRVEAELLDRHPELAEDIDKSRQSRIDSMRLSTRFVDDERWVPKSRRPGIDEDVKRTKGDQFLTPTKSKAVDEDFPFTMDEDGSSHSPMPPSVDNSPSIRPIASEQNLSVRGQSLSLPPNSVDTDASNLATPLQPAVGSPDVTVSGFELPKAWTASTPSNSKTDFKSIMEQTSSSRVSNLSQAINAAAVGPSKSVPKMSQSQRKKQAQEMKKQEVVIKELETKSSPSPSPWIKTTPIVTRSITSPLIEAGPPTIPSPAPARPTIVSPQTSSKGPVNTKVASTRNTPGTTRTVSSPALGESPKPIVPQIQSVRHIPLTNRSRSFVDSHTSMAEILAQEQADKMAIKEAAAKRSLQEIQQEQEFEAWWSAESKRVQEEEAQAQAVASNQRESNRKSSRGRGNRKRGSARGAASVSVASPAEEQIQPAKSEPSTATIPDQTESGRGRNPGRSRGRGTGNGRGRGRGKIQAT